MQFDDIMSCLACEKQQQQQQHQHHHQQQQHSFNQKNEANNYLLKLKKDYEKFFQKYQSINNLNTNISPGNGGCGGRPAVATLIEAKPDELVNTISQLVPCIGCRTSVERFYKQLVAKQQISSNKKLLKSTNFALDPFLINQNGNLTLKKSVMLNPMLIFKLLYING